MEGLARATGSIYRELTVGGKPWRLAPPRLRDIANLEAALLAALPDPIQQAAAAAINVPVDQRDQFWRAAFAAAAQQRRYTLENLDQLPPILQTAAAAYLALQRHHSDEIPTLQAALDWCDKALSEYGDRLAAELTAVVQEMPTTSGIGRNQENP